MKTSNWPVYKSANKSWARIGLGFVALMICTRFASAQVINFDVPGGESGGVNYSGQGAYADAGHNYWNPIIPGGTTATATNSDGATVSSITLTEAQAGNYNDNGPGTQGTPSGLQSYFAYANNSTIQTNTLNHLPAGTYNLYLYGINGGMGDCNRGTIFTVSSDLTPTITNSTVNTSAAYSSFIQGNDYVVFTNVVVGPGATITFTYTHNPSATGTVGNTEGDFNGLQLVRTTVVNFDVPGGESGGVNYSGQGAYVDAGHNYWNSVVPGGTTATATNSDGATVSSITLTETQAGDYNDNGPGTQGTPSGLQSYFAYANNSTIQTNTLNHVPAGTYSLYLYGINGGLGDCNRGAIFTVSSDLTPPLTNSTINTSAAYSSFIQGNDYVVFTNVVVGPGATITFTYTHNPAATGISGNTEGDFNGLQLISGSGSRAPISTTYPAIKIPTLNSNEIVVAQATPQDYGAKGDGITDDSAAFQNAINAVYHSGGNGGSVVYVPAGNYAFYTNITLQTGVTLHGDWQDWTRGTNGLVGTTFKVYFGAGSTNGTPFIQMKNNSSLKGINIWYPNQNPNSITAYPFTINLGDNSVVQNVVLINSYQGIEVSGNTEWIVSTVIGSPLFMGLTATAIADMCHTEDIRFSPAVWAASKLTNAPSAGGAYATWMRTNGEGMQIFRLDGLLNINTAISGYKIGLDFEQDANGASGCSFYNGSVTNCAIAADIQQAQISGLEFSDFTLDGDIAINRTVTTNDAAAQFDDCQIVGRKGVAVYDTGADWRSTMQFQNCTISNLMQLAGPGIFNLVDCTLNGTTQCLMSASATRAAFTGCTFSPSQKIVNNGNAANLIIDSRQSISNAMPLVDWTNVMSRYAACRPAKTNLFIATTFGATGNGATDDTLAIQNALNAAGTNGGGIVYLPAGNYHTTNTLNIPGGVELRGAYELRHGTSGGSDGIEKGSTIKTYGGQGTTNGPAAVVLNTNSGLVGLTFDYPNQTNISAFPPTIQGRGGNVYAIGVQCGEPYIYVDLDSYTCTNHFLDMVDGWALSTGVRVGNGSSGSIVDTHCNPTYWVNNPSGQNTWLQTTGWDMANSYAMSNLQFYVLGNCTELFVKDFVYGQEMFMHCSSESGQAAHVTAISATCDSAYRAYTFDGAGSCTFTDVNPDWLVTLPNGSQTNSIILYSETNFQGTVRIFNSPFWGSANVDYLVNGGDIGFELVHLWQTGNTGGVVNGGVFHLINAGDYNDPNPLTVSYGPNAGLAGKTNEFIGCYSYYGCAVTNSNPANPADVWVDYGLLTYDMLGGPPNLALDRPVTVSSVADGTQGSNAVDGNLNTRWGSAYSDPQWIYVDLGTNYNITAVELVWETAYGKNYQIQVSTNTSVWTTIYSETNGTGGTEYLSGLSGVGRYVRIYGTTRGTIYGYSLWEFEVFGNLSQSNILPIFPPGPLSIQATSPTQRLTLAWPDNGSKELAAQPSIYFTPDLTPPAQWTLVTNIPFYSNGNWIVSLPMTSTDHGFYRLK